MFETAITLMASVCAQTQEPVPASQQSPPIETSDESAPSPPGETIEVTPEHEHVPEKRSRWFVRAGGLQALYNSSAKIRTSAGVIPGSNARVTDSTTLIFDVGYDLSDDVSVMLMGGIPPTADVIGEGSVSAFGKLGEVRFGPVVLTGVYRLPEWRGFRPYVGAGGAHLFILDSRDGEVQKLKVKDSWGFVLQSGVEYRLNDRWDLFVDYKRIWLGVDASGSLGGAPVRARVTLNPDALSAGVKLHFR